MLERFKFGNFIASRELVTSADATLDKTLAHAPSDSSVVASLDKIGNTFRCHIDVHSSVGHFMGESIGEIPQAAVNVAAHKLNDSLRHWRDKKTTNSHPGSSVLTSDHAGHYDVDGVSLAVSHELKVVVASDSTH